MSYCYFARQSPFDNHVDSVHRLVAIRWEAIFIMKCAVMKAHDTLYERDDASQIFLHHVSQKDYELLDAFDVTKMCPTEFDSIFRLTRPQYVYHREGSGKRLSKRA